VILADQSLGASIDVVSSTHPNSKMVVSESDSDSNSEENKSMLFTALDIIFINSVFV
jgi:hypothetical protein